MGRLLGMSRVIDRIFILSVVVFLVIVLNQSVLAKDAGITIQTALSSSYATTMPLTQPILDQLGASANTANVEEIRKVLSQLRDGDILVLSVHSNPSVFGVGDNVSGGAVQWGGFWNYFGIRSPPKLAAVIIGGCMYYEREEEGRKKIIPISEAEAESIRRSLNAWTLFLPRAGIHPVVAINDTNHGLQSILAGKKFSEINLAGKWHYLSDPELDRDQISLVELRAIGRQFFQESDIDYLVPAIRPREVLHRGVMKPPTFQNILNEGVWGAIEYSGKWVLKGEVKITGGTIAYLTPEKAKALFEEDAKGLRESFEKQRRYRKEWHKIKEPGLGTIKERPDRLTWWMPWVEGTDVIGDRVIQLRYKNTVIFIGAEYYDPIEETQLPKIMEDMEISLILVVDSALERLEIEFEEK